MREASSDEGAGTWGDRMNNGEGTMNDGSKQARGTVSKPPADMNEQELRDHIVMLVAENKGLIRQRDTVYEELQAVKARVHKLVTG